MGLRIDQKIVLVTRATQLAALRRRYNTRSQAKFKIVSAKKRELARKGQASAATLDELAEASFEELDRAAEQYDDSVRQLRRDLEFDEFDLPLQLVDRDFLPNFVFGPRDVVVTVGQDGLVANTAKYAAGLPIVAVNPDPKRIDGILLPFRTDQAREAVSAVLHAKAKVREVTMAEATLDDGRRLLAFNELFIGVSSHLSARYRLTVGGTSESQSSSGMIVSTGAGSTGWLSSMFNMAAGVAALAGAETSGQPIRLSWDDPRLVYVVREPFVSKTSGTRLVAGIIQPGREIEIESEMTSNGVIFSDGVESDYLEFGAGTLARVRTAPTKARLVVG